jgi:IS30 family transposase
MNLKYRKEIVRNAFLLRHKNKSISQIATQLGVGESTVSSWLRGDTQQDVLLEFFPNGKSPYRKDFPTEASIQAECEEYIKAEGLNYTFLKTKRERAKNGQKLWYVYFKCDKNHLEKKSLGNFRKTRGCRQCVGQNLEFELHLKRLRKVHKNKYDYSLFIEQGFTNIKDNIKIICPIHGEFEQKYESHRNGKGCADCAGNIPKSGREIADIVTKNSEGDLTLDNIDENKTYKSEDVVTIKCLTYDWHPQEQRKVGKLVNAKSLNCKTCRSSRYEKMAIKTLQRLNVFYEPQLKIRYDDDSIGFIDFAVHLEGGSKLFIEVDGEQHHSPSNRGPGFDYVIDQDRKKNEFARQNAIQLHRISFEENISEALENLLEGIDYRKVDDSLNKQDEFRLKDDEAKALEIHRLAQQGLTGKEIAYRYKVYPSYISKILRGNRFTDLFLSLYPDGKNPHIKDKGFKHYKINQEHEDWIVSKFKANFTYSEIINNFNIMFPETSAITKGVVQRVVKKHNLKSNYFIEWTDELKHEVLEMQSQGQSISSIARKVSAKAGRTISKQGLREAIRKF